METHKLIASLAVILFWIVFVVATPILIIFFILLFIGSTSGLVYTMVSDNLIAKKKKKGKLI